MCRIENPKNLSTLTRVGYFNMDWDDELVIDFQTKCNEIALIKGYDKTYIEDIDNQPIVLNGVIKRCDRYPGSKYQYLRIDEILIYDSITDLTFVRGTHIDDKQYGEYLQLIREDKIDSVLS